MSGTISTCHCCTMNWMFVPCRIFVTGLLLINIVLFMLPTHCGSFPVSKRMLDEAVSNEFNADGVRQLPLAESSKINASCFNNTDKIYDSTHLPLIHHHRRRKRVGQLKEALIYLRQYGYLGNKPLSAENVEQALRAFQRLAGIQESGRLTKLTLDKMHNPRCGNIDIARETRSKHKKRFAQVSKWENKIERGDILRLKWFIEKYTNDIPINEIRDTVKKSFQLWSDQALLPSMRTIKLSFTEGSFAENSDINILWAEGEHGDAYPFDGPGNNSNILAHTFYPNYQDIGTLNGNIHFDDYENWVLDNRASIDQGVYFPYVLTHEIGHALGLGHSNRQEAVMNPIYKQIPLTSLILDVDDKCALNWNYIGPSSTCLFVWLMVEYLPKIPKDNNSTGNNNNKLPPTSPAAGFPPDPYKTNRVGELSIEKKISQLFQSLQYSEIPQCSADNAVKFQYEELIIKKLNLNRHEAHYYSEIACNFAAGLSKVIDKQKLLSSDTNYQTVAMSDSTHNNAGPLQMTVHAYPSSPHKSHNELNSEEFRKEIFDENFFRNILLLLVKSR